MSDRGFWTTYRRGVAVALVFWLSSAGGMIWLFCALTQGGSVPLWPVLPLLIVAGITGAMVSPSDAIPNGPPYCPTCGKSVFHAFGIESIGLGAAPMWPEKDCSQCGYDLTEPRSA
ncbi:hypothetical protein [Allosphingosinicella deserti]|uniref:Uncharacterized protein n=1 Tax=Allosphingosinicella deserti TaxID=2116704 RepID=A0A2P7QV08_9SPHN|nr:hypothetical protein [Sphingomonas deserti]PSJ41798.1 hypothetical protein C7I55_05840 [Sphingomonas deserti]